MGVDLNEKRVSKTGSPLFYRLDLLVLPFLTGKPISTTKDTGVTKGNHSQNSSLFHFAYFASFVVGLFPVGYGRADLSKESFQLFDHASRHRLGLFAVKDAHQRLLQKRTHHR